MQRVFVFGGTALVAAIAAAIPFFKDSVVAPTQQDGSSASSVPSFLETPGRNDTRLPFDVYPGYVIELLADVPGARVIVRDGFGNYWVSQMAQGTVSHLEMSGATVRTVSTPLRGLNKPHGLAIGPEEGGFTLYVAEQDKISRVHLYSDAPIEHVADLPAGGLHVSRTLGFGPDGRLYVSVGSTCNACDEKDERHAAIFSMLKDGTDQRIEATGLRNAVFFRWHDNGKLYATEMGRDMLGDGLPPEEVNIVERGAHYGWPYCYGDRVRDRTFRKNVSFDCASTKSPFVQLPAHIAPLGLDFLPDGNLLVAAHGSWNSSVKVGYKVVRIPLDGNGNPDGEPTDFLRGFYDGSTVHGRPVDILIEKNGDILITDDHNGAVYRMQQL